MLNRGSIVYSLNKGNSDYMFSEKNKDTGNLVLNDARGITPIVKDTNVRGISQSFAEPIKFSEKDSLDSDRPKNNIERMTENPNHKNINNVQDIRISFTDLENADTIIEFGSGGVRQFKISDVLRYVSKDCVTNIHTDEETFFHIKKLFFSYNKDHIIFRSYEKSPITGNLEILLKISQKIKIYEKNKLNDILDKTNDRIKCESKIKYFNYALNNHILKIISNVMQVVHKDNQYIDIVCKLQNYAVNIMNKINQYIYQELDLLSKKDIFVDNLMEKIIDSKKNLQSKLESLEREINIQNGKLDAYTEKLNIYDNNMKNSIDQSLVLRGGTTESASVNINNNSPANKSVELRDNTASSFSGASLSQSIENKLNEKLGKTIDDLFNGNDDNGFDEETHIATNNAMIDILSDDDTNSIYRML